MKKFLSVLLALTMVLSLGVAAFAEGGTDDGKLTVWCWDPTFNIAAMNTAKEMYQADHPDVEIEIVEILSEDIEQRVMTSSGDTTTLPDILLVQDHSIQKFVTNYPEVYHDLTGLYDYTDFSPAKVALSTVDGKNYGVPFDSGTCVGAWRTDYLEQAGYTIDDLTDISWDRLIEIGRDVKEKTGMPMLSGQAGAVDTVLIMLQSCGGSMFNEDGSINIKDNDKLKAVIETYNTMVSEGIFIEVNSWDEYIGTLSNGSVVGTVNGCWILSTIMSLTDQAGKWDITNLPAMEGIDGATHYSANGGSSWAIVNGKDIDLAIDFLKLYSNVDFYNAILPTTSAIACYTPAKDGEAYTAPSDFFNGKPVFSTIVEFGANVPTEVTGPFYYDAREQVGNAVTTALQGGDLDSALSDAQDQVEFAMEALGF